MRLLFAAGALLAGTCVAIADDRPGQWSGFYAGGGITFGEAEMEFPDGEIGGEVNGSPIDPNTTEGSVGGHVIGGYLFQSGRFLFGAEADAEFGDGSVWEEVSPSDGCGASPCAEAGVVGEFETFGHVRGVVGYAFSPRIMGFVAGGAAFARGKFSGGYAIAEAGNALSPGSFGLPDAPEEDFVGYSIGGGIQVQATERLRIRAEVLHDRYDSFDIPDVGTGASVGSGGDSASATVNTNGSAEFHNTSARLSILVSF